ncbi:alpha/beta hydrolase [Fibrobacter sp.]|uniref:poly(ethylene terephthalate) hydrolase family protein n=1 Tax=Fibrobacter sp. TaxID=35828 RepID=UPI00386BB18D
MKSRIFRGAVLASAIAFINCGDDPVTSPFPPTGDISSSSIEVPAESSSSEGAPAESSSSEIAPASSSDAAPASSETAPSSSSDIQPSSSDVASSSSAVQLSSSSENAPESSSAKVESSSSEKKVESSSSAEAPKGIFLASGKEEEKDQLKVVYKTNTGWDNKGILAYPEQLSSDQKHGVVVWGPGGGTEPGAYEGMIRRLASHGFVVIALSVSPGDATQATKAIDWLENKNKDSNDPFYQKLELTKVGCSGHSMGGLESEQAAIKDKRVFTAFLNNSGDKNGGVIKNFPKEKTAAVLYGEVGMEKPNAIKDYETAKDIKSCLIEMTGGPKNNSEGGYGHGSGSWDGMAATIAWMRWQLGGETERKADFVGTSGKYIDGNIIGKQGKWKTQCKNF